MRFSLIWPIDISSKIEESSLLLKDNAKIDLKILHVDGSSRGQYLYHNVFKITLKQGGEEYVLDLSGAQFGVHCPVMPWATFLSSRVQELLPGSMSEGGEIYYSPLGTARAQIMRHIWMFGSLAGAMEVNNIASVGLDSAFKTANESQKDITFRDALRGLEKRWEEWKAEILHQVDFSLAKMKEVNDQVDAEVKKQCSNKV